MVGKLSSPSSRVQYTVTSSEVFHIHFVIQKSVQRSISQLHPKKMNIERMQNKGASQTTTLQQKRPSVPFRRTHSNPRNLQASVTPNSTLVHETNLQSASKGTPITTLHSFPSSVGLLGWQGDVRVRDGHQLATELVFRVALGTRLRMGLGLDLLDGIHGHHVPHWLHLRDCNQPSAH
jgi:hypothetical protein